MSDPISVQVVAAPVACSGGVKAAWRDAAALAARQLWARFGPAVRVDYVDLFEPDCPPLPPDAQLPVVLVDGVVLSSGTKVSVPAIRRRLEAMGLKPQVG